MKIGIITAYNAYNYGAVLQAIALKKVLNKMGHEVQFIETYSEITAWKIFLASAPIENIGNFKDIHNIRFAIDVFIKFRKIRKQFHAIPLKHITKNTFDVVIIGSDELWNLSIETRLKGIFYGQGIPCPHIITYAISSGKTKHQAYKKYPYIIDNMKKLEMILVRDTVTQNNMENLFQKQCPKVVDPTLLAGNAPLSRKCNEAPRDPFLLIYGYSFDGKIKKYICNYAKEHHLKTVSVCMKHDWTDQSILCHPMQFSDLIARSEGVITSTFHGTIFSILNHKPFISLATAPKTVELMKDLKMEDAFLDNTCTYTEFKNKLDRDISFEESDREIKKRRKKSLNLLYNYLQKIQNEK